MVARQQLDRNLEAAAGAADDLMNDLLALGDTPLDRTTWLEVLARTGQSEGRLHAALNRVSTQLGLPRGAKPRLLEYLKLRKGKVVDRRDLAGVAGISEWARRVRELRVEDGWPIASSMTNPDLRAGEYRLESDAPDAALAARWNLANRIRRQGGSIKSRLQSYMLASVGQPLSKDELQYVAKKQEYPRRIRELVEEGWQIESNLDRPELASGQYVLVSQQLLPARARQAIKLRYQILDRDNNRCRSCGATPGNGRRLQVHHELPVSYGGTNDPGNLETLCDVCHAGKHALMAAQVEDELLQPALESPLSGQAPTS